jgi:lipooligosaccharide transport system permease protein
MLARILPLTHLVDLSRAVVMGYWDPSLPWSVAYLAVFCLIFFPLAIARMQKRLIH